MDEYVPWDDGLEELLDKFWYEEIKKLLENPEYQPNADKNKKE